VFFLIGTALWVFYREAHLLPAGMEAKEVFPWFMRQELPPGFRGLVLAALLAAAMDSNLTSMATLYWCDVHQKIFGATREGDGADARGLRVMRCITVVFATASGVVALAMLRAQAILDQWWKMAGFCSGGMLGLFLLGRFLPDVKSRAAAIGVIGGTLLMVWMFISPLCPWLPGALRSPFHELLIMVFGTIGVIACGWLASLVPSAGDSRQNPEDAIPG
jgi:SSS family solute:Na+ symporter